MLTLEQIVALSKEHNFPAGREKQALAEYLQCIMLQSLFQHVPSGKISFIGGTSLRFFYNISRFSEDLDFDNFGLAVDEFEATIELVVRDLLLQGFQVDAVIKIKGAFHCYVRFGNLLYQHKLSPYADEKILVKIDTVVQDFPIEPEKKFFNRYGIVEEIAVNPKDILMAQKAGAILGRKTAKGRDFYDFIFLDGITKPHVGYLAHKFQITSLVDLKVALLKRCQEVDFNEMVRDVQPFLFHERDALRIQKFQQYIEQWQVEE